MLQSVALRAVHNRLGRVSSCSSWHAVFPHCRASANRRDTLPDLSDTVVSLEINLLVFQAAPEALNKNIIHPASLTVHADFDTAVLQHVRKIFAGKLTALVAVEYLRCAIKAVMYPFRQT